MALALLYVDDAILVLNKPAGLPVLPEGWQPGAPCLVRELEQEYGGLDGKKALWVVHRLDKTTSGVMVFARSAHAHRELNRQFEQRQVAKLYHAILQGAPDWEERTARHPLRVDVGHGHRTAVDARRGKPAETRFGVLERFPACALVEAEPRTGRTHQIRVHAAALGHPLLGDTLYGADASSLIARPALHAYSLAFCHPLTGQSQSYLAPYPEDFTRAVERLGAKG